VRPEGSDGVFETMLVRDGRIQALAHHLDRLGRSIAALYGRRLPPGLPDRLRAHAAATTGEHRLRVDVVPGEDLGVAMTPVGTATRRAVTLAPLVLPGGLGAHKWRDRRLLDARPADPAPLLVDADGTVLEGAWGNLWLIEGDRLLTPPADGRILPGVTRALLLELAPALGYHAHETPIALDRARRAPVTFMTSAIRLAVPAGLADRAAPPTAAVDHIRAALAAHW
jgi:para-aminobenzoate synthetase / 4-amino-4-deoxychorismate lyase